MYNFIIITILSLTAKMADHGHAGWIFDAMDAFSPAMGWPHEAMGWPRAAMGDACVKLVR
jgi:hypothetical protein